MSMSLTAPLPIDTHTGIPGATPIGPLPLLLPPNVHPQSLSNERDQLVTDILQKTHTAFFHGDFIGLKHQISCITNFMAHKFYFTIHERVKLIAILDSIVLCPTIPANVHQSTMTIYKRIVSKPKNLADHITLPSWQSHLDQILNICNKVTLAKDSHFSFMADSQATSAYLQLIAKLRRLFPAEATQGILDQILPMFQPSSQSIYYAQGLFCLFIPTTGSASQHDLWLDTVFKIWPWVENNLQWDLQWINLLARLAKNQRGNIDWSPYLPVIMDKISTLLSPTPQSTLTPSKDSLGAADSLRLPQQTSFRKAGKLLVYIHSQQSPALDSAAMLLSKLNNAFHPSLSSQQSPQLGDFVVGLARQLSKRIHEDTFNDPQPQEPITDDDVDALIDVLLPAVSQGLFSKSGPLSMCSIAAIKHMAFIRPDKVLPKLIDNTYLALESFESHRTTVLLEAVAVTMRQIHATHVDHIPALLELALPGIDANDFGKTFATFRVAFALLSWMPILSQNDPMAEWSLSFLSQLFAMFPHLDKSEKKDYAVTGPLMSITSHLFWAQLDENVFSMALNNLDEYIRNNTDINAKREISYLIAGAARARSKQSLEVLVPSLTRMIKSDTSSSTKRQLSLYLLGQLLRFAGQDILSHKDDVIAVLDDHLTNPDDKSVRIMASKCLRYFLHGLSASYITKLHSFDNGNIDLENMQANWHVPNPDELQSTQSIILHFLDPAIDSLKSIMKDSHDGSDSFSPADRASLADTLSLMSNISRGAAWYLPDWSEKLVFDSPLPSRKGFIAMGETPYDLESNYPHAITATATSGNPDDSIRYRMAKTVHSFSQFVLAQFPDDSSLMTQICSTIGAIMSLVWCTPGKRGSSIFLNEQLKRKYHTPVNNETFSRYIYLTDAQNAYLSRVELAAKSLPYLETHKTLQEDLFALSQSRYENVRGKAVKTLTGTFWRFPYSKMAFIRRIADVVGTPIDSEVQSQAEYRASLLGCMELANNKLIINRIVRDWKSMFVIIKAVLACIATNDDDKLSNQLNVAFFQIFKGIRSIHVPPLDIWNQQLAAIDPSQYPEYPDQSAVPDVETAKQTLQDNLQDASSHFVALVDHLLDQFNSGDNGSSTSSSSSQSSWSHHLIVTILLSTMADHSILFDSDEFESQRHQLQLLFLSGLQSELPPLRTGSITALILMMSRQLGRGIVGRHLSDGSTIHEGWLQHIAGESPSSTSNNQSADNVDLKPAYAMSQSHPILQLFNDDDQIAGFLSYVSQDQPVQSQDHATSMRSRMMNAFFHGNMTGLGDLTNGILKSILHTFTSARYVGRWGPMISNQDFVQGYAVFFESAFTSLAHHTSVDKDALQSMIQRVLDQCQALLQDNGQNSDESSNARAKEMTVSYVIGGLVRSVDAWPMSLDERNSIVDAIIAPTLKQFLEDASPETSRSWVSMLTFVMREKSIANGIWIYDLVSSIAFDGKTSFSQSNRMLYLAAVISELSWRIDDSRMEPLVAKMIDSIPDSYKQVRIQIAMCLSLVFAVRWMPSNGLSTDVRSLIERGQTMQDTLFKGHLGAILESLDGLRRQEEQNQNVSGYVSESEGVTSEYQKLAEVLVNMVVMLTENGGSFVIEPYIDQVLPSIFLLQDEKSDQKMTERALGCISLISQTKLCLDMTQRTLDELSLLVNSPSWRVRGSLLALIGNMYANGQFALSQSMKEQLFGFVAILLQDQQLEVREAACGSLSNMLNGIEDKLRQELIAQYRDLASTKIKKKKKKKNNGSGSSSGSSSSSGSMSIEDELKKEKRNNKKLRARHAGVLGLCALVLANPYDVPEEWMPEVLMELTGHVSDPSPINESVKSLFLEFKRTHQDSWHLEKLKFTHDQLAVLTDLMVSPSYYV